MFWGMPIPEAEMGHIGFKFYQRDTNRFKRASNCVLGPHHPDLQKMIFAHNELDWRVWGYPRRASLTVNFLRGEIEKGPRAGLGHSRCLESICGDFLYIAVIVIGAIRRSRD